MRSSLCVPKNQQLTPQPVIASEPPRMPEPPRSSSRPSAEPAPGTIGWLWPEDAATGGGGPGGRGYRPPGRGSGSGRWRYRTATLIAAGAVVLAAAGLVVGMFLHSTPSGHGKSQAGATLKPTPKKSATPTLPPSSSPWPGPLRAHAGEVVRASAWVNRQVRPDAIVACDPQLCGTLKAGGFPAAHEVRIGNELAVAVERQHRCRDSRTPPAVQHCPQPQR